MDASHRMYSDPTSLMFNAKSLQQVAETIAVKANPEKEPYLFQGQCIASPVLLAFSMELALKAWRSREAENQKVPKTHDLLKLFDGLSEDAQLCLDEAFPVIPNVHPQLPPIRPGLRSILSSHKDAFVIWRYVHERRQARFEDGIFNDALTAVIDTFVQMRLARRQ